MIDFLLSFLAASGELGDEVSTLVHTAKFICDPALDALIPKELKVGDMVITNNSTQYLGGYIADNFITADMEAEAEAIRAGNVLGILHQIEAINDYQAGLPGGVHQDLPNSVQH